MEFSGGITASLAGRYASALFDLAKDRDLTGAVEGDLANLAQAIRESDDLADLIRNPEISRDASAKAMDGVAGVLGLSELTRNFLGVLANNRRLAKLPEIARAVAAIAAAQRGEMTAQVTTAHPLDDSQHRDLAARLKAREGRDVKIEANVDPEILGGLVVTIGSRRIDGSLRTRLNSLAQAMKG
ncbi:MAG: F0F1 ATP synthase subunit delta [Novosphingobium sp.]|nr:F0F1 ATP synthase subunit delta [Novosphingobium sp.]